MERWKLNKIRILIIIALALIGAVVWRYVSKKESPLPSIKTTEEALNAISEPAIGVGSNPVENKVPELNPVDIANPFNNSYKNPFE